jgi:hypothetical protein
VSSVQIMVSSSGTVENYICNSCSAIFHSR